MRKLQNIVRLLAAAFLPLAVACDPVDLTPMHPPVPGFENVEVEDHCIILRLDPAFSQLLPTKAGDTERGLDPLHENQINTIDCFFFKTGQTDQPPIFRAIGRTVEADTQKDSTECFVKVYYNDDIAQLLFDSTTSGTCEAFVIANASINYASDCTLDQLRQSTLEYDFSQQEVQPYFTMCSRETAQVTLYSIRNPEVNDPTDKNYYISTAAGRVPLYRCAAKAQLYLKLPETFKDAVSGNTYEPCPGELGGIQVRLATGVKKTYANGDYRVTDQDYIHFADRPMYKIPKDNFPVSLVEGKTDYDYGHVPFYSYPMSWTDLDKNAANYIFSIPWRKINYADDGETVTGYGDPELRYYKLSANVIGRKFEANGFYRTFVYVQSLGDASLDQAEVIDECYYIISDWVHEGVAAAAGSESISGEFIRYKFLVVEPDEVTLNNETKYTFNFSSSADLLNSKVIIDRVEFTKYNTGKGVFNSVSGNSQSQFTNNQIDKNEYKVTYNYRDGEIYFEHKLDEVYEQRDIYLTVTNRDGISQTVKIHQRPAIMLQLNSDEKYGDVFVDGFFARVANAKDVNGNNFVTSYSPSYNNNGINWSGTYWTSRTSSLGDGNGNGVTKHYSVGDNVSVSVNGQSGSYNYNNYGSISTGREDSENPMYTVEVNVSAFTSTNHTYSYQRGGVDYTSEYRIADPRVKASSVYPNGFTLHPYLTRRANSTYYGENWDSPGDIMIAVQDDDLQNYIAPRFLVSSSLNGQSSKPNFENTVKRAAVYQEAGYPAGRWRLPTEAELAFLFARQQDGTIPKLFKTDGDGRYRAASGRYMTVTGTVVNFKPNDNQSVSSRFVYDLWYWGDTPAAPNVYHPNGHNTTY